jgi:hypothetical protein
MYAALKGITAIFDISGGYAFSQEEHGYMRQVCALLVLDVCRPYTAENRFDLAMASD